MSNRPNFDRARTVRRHGAARWGSNSGRRTAARKRDQLIHERMPKVRRRLARLRLDARVAAAEAARVRRSESSGVKAGGQ